MRWWVTTGQAAADSHHPPPPAIVFANVDPAVSVSRRVVANTRWAQSLGGATERDGKCVAMTFKVSWFYYSER